MDIEKILSGLKSKGNFRTLPEITHCGKHVVRDGREMLNLSSNDYLGLASDAGLREVFLSSLKSDDFVFSASSSRLLTGNCEAYGRLESRLASMYGREAALVFSSGYLMNAGILPAIADESTLVLADKLVHASMIDGIRLSNARTIRYRHGDIEQLSRLVSENCSRFSTIVIMTESIFSMDGDVSDLRQFVKLKKRYPGVILYVDEAHAAGTRGDTGLGIAQEQGCIADIDIICGTFGKAFASVGAYTVCSSDMRSFLVNRMRTLIFNTALPPLNIMWTDFILSNSGTFSDRRRHLADISSRLRAGLASAGLECESASNIVPVVAGSSDAAVRLSEHMQNAGFYLLPVRPPTVPEGTARLRVSLTASVTENEVDSLLQVLRTVSERSVWEQEHYMLRK